MCPAAPSPPPCLPFPYPLGSVPFRRRPHLARQPRPSPSPSPAPPRGGPAPGPAPPLLGDPGRGAAAPLGTGGPAGPGPGPLTLRARWGRAPAPCPKLWPYCGAQLPLPSARPLPLPGSVCPLLPCPLALLPVKRSRIASRCRTRFLPGCPTGWWCRSKASSELQSKPGPARRCCLFVPDFIPSVIRQRTNQEGRAHSQTSFFEICFTLEKFCNFLFHHISREPCGLQTLLGVCSRGLTARGEGCK